MFSHLIAPWLQKRGIHYAWVVMAVTFLTMLSTACALGAPGVLLPVVAKAFGWSVASVSGAVSFRLVLMGLIAPFAAALLIRFGISRVVSVALTLIGAGLAGSIWVGNLWQLAALWGLCVGIGTGMTAIVLGATVASRWFSTRRGLVIGILTASNATGQLVGLPVIAWLSETFGWRAALGWACAPLIVALVLVVMLMRNRPEDIGLRPYGETAPTAVPIQTPALSALSVLREVIVTTTFWILAVSFFVCGSSTNGLIQTHFVSLCGDFGLAAVTAASVLAVMGLFDFVGTIGSGWLSDRYDSRFLLFGYYGLRGLSLLFLPESEFTFGGLSLFAVFYGLDWIATVPPTLKLTAETFGRERAGIVFGWIFCAHQIGAAVIASVAGLIRTETGSYIPAFLLAGSLCLGAALLVLMLRRPKVESAHV